MSPSPYAPNEPAEYILDEVAWIQGAFLGSLLCGMQVTLSAMSFLAVLKQRIRRRLRIVLLIYISLLCTVVTAGQQSSLLYVQTGFTYSRNYPGGPKAFLNHHFTMPFDLAATTLFVFADWMTDSLLVWRSKVVCMTGDRPMWCGVILPSVLLVSKYVTGSLYLCHLYGFSVTHHVLRIALVYMSLSLLLNMTVTGVIAGRLLLHRRRMVRQFGRGHGSNYASTATILIESASLYSGCLIVFIVCSSVHTRAMIVLQQVAAQVESIASLLIIYRIAQGKGWKDDMGVSSVDWRGDSQPHAEPVAVDLEMAVGSAQACVHGRSVPSKENEMPTSMSASCLDATATPDDGV